VIVLESGMINNFTAIYCVTRSSTDAEEPHDVSEAQNVALEKACNRGMIYKDIQGHYNCYY